MIDFMNGFVPGAVTWVDKRRPKWRQIVCAAALAVFAGVCASGCVSAKSPACPMQQTKEQKIEARVREMSPDRLIAAYGRYASGVNGSYDERCRYFATMRVFEERKEQSGVLTAVETYALSGCNAIASRDAVRFLQRANASRLAAMRDIMLRIYRQSRTVAAKAEALAVLEEEKIKVPELYFDASGNEHTGMLKESEERYRAFVNRS